MTLILILSIPFLLVLVAPWLYSRLRMVGALILALGPLSMFGWFLLQTRSLLYGQSIEISYPWVSIANLNVDFALRLDGLSLLFAFLITGIGTGIVIYSGSYMAEYPTAGRFFAYLFLFMGAMLGLVLADDLITLFVFWELTSVSSYLLIGFNHEKKKAREGARKALLITAGGGLALLLGFVILGDMLGSYAMADVLANGEMIRTHPLYGLVLFLVVLGTFSKSAQFPLHFWLPDAMQAPTPASAYLHSATMVKAGVYLLARLHPAMGGTELWQYVLGLLGLLTMLLAGYLAFKQDDLKALLAYSTISALGQLVALIGLGTVLAMKAAMVFILAHALYKSLLFLIVGIVDHETGTRDLTKLGGLARALPLTTAVAAVGALSLAGVPPLFGFLAKEVLLEAGLVAQIVDLPALLVPIVVIAASVITVGYSLLFFYRVFMGPMQPTPKHPHEAPYGMLVTPIVLAVLSVLLSFPPFRTEIAGLMGSAAGNSLAQAVTVNLYLWHGINLPLIASMSALIGGAILYAIHRPFRRTQRLWPENFRVDRLYDYSFVLLDVVATTVTKTLQSGILRRYLMTILLTLFFLVGYALIVSPVGAPWAYWTLHTETTTRFLGAVALIVVALLMLAIRLTIANRGTPGARYIYTTVGVLALLTAVVLFFEQDPTGRPWPVTEANIYEWTLAVILVMAVISVAAIPSRLGAVVALGTVGYLIALFFVLYSAPDLVLTQLLIETLTVILLLLVFYLLPSYFEDRSPLWARLRDLFVAASVGAMITLLIWEAVPMQLSPPISQYFVENSLPLGFGANIVNVILVDFRSLDTLGEIVVLIIAAISILGLIRLRPSIVRPASTNDPVHERQLGSSGEDPSLVDQEEEEALRKVEVK
jgi:multicomponent Na+:H+ antiporter subunit A